MTIRAVRNEEVVIDICEWAEELRSNEGQVAERFSDLTNWSLFR